MFLRNMLMSQSAAVVTPTSPTITANTANMNGSTMYYNYGSAITSGVSTLSFGFFIKPDTIGATHRILNEEISDKAQFAVFLNASGFIAAGYRTTSGGSFSQTTGSTVLVAGTKYSVVITLDVSSSMKIYVNAVEDADDSRSSAAITTGSRTHRNIGRRGHDNAQHLDGAIGFIGFWSSVLDSSAVTDFHNGGVPFCYDSLPASLTSTLLHYWHSAEFTDHTADELTDQEGSNDLTNVGSIPFVDSGFTVQCT
jgi:hypothetical protein